MGFVPVKNTSKIMFSYGNGIYPGYSNLGMFSYLHFVSSMIFFQVWT